MLISPEYAALNAELHREKRSYGGVFSRAANLIRVAEQFGTKDILDYGCGKGMLAKVIPWPIKEYDPAIPGKDALPEPAELVICRDVLEHVEPECLDAVLADLARCVKRCGLFSIATGPSWKTLPDGRNPHLIQRPCGWWKEKLSKHFAIDSVQEISHISGKGHRLFIGGSTVFVAVTPKRRNSNGRG